MKLYNTPKKQVEDVKPQSPPAIGVYTCGPTVYDYPHVGNWFTFIRYDLLIRALQAAGYQPQWALNITDVGHLVSDADEGEDKLQKGASREGKSAWEIADFYTEYFIKGLDRLNFIKPSHLPRATQHITEQIDFIKALEDKGYTYKIDDGIYFETSHFPQYGQFANLDLEEQQTRDRISPNPQKHNPSDFALWKFSPVGAKRDMEWDSPWGKGFPGWHIECSAMVKKYFGDTVDIHAGGIDHIPVHHTNEIAQSTAITGKPLANYWLHTNHILVDEKKIAKSEGNGITLEDVEAKGFNLQALRLLVLQSHYRTQSKFSWDELEAANNRLQALRAMAVLRYQPVSRDNWVKQTLDIEVLKQALIDDLNTPQLLAALSGFAALAEDRLISPTEVNDFEKLLHAIDELTGLQLTKEADITSDQKTQIDAREKARESKDWATADSHRDRLLEQGIELRDTPHGPIWYRK